MAALDGTVKLPGLGDVKKKYLAVAGGAVAVIVGVGYYRKRQAAVLPVTTAQTDSGAFPDTTPVGPGGPNGVTDQFGNPLPAQIVQSANPGITTNEDWLSEADSLNIGIPSDSISTACSRVLGGLSVTSAQADIYHMVVGAIGPPPQTPNPVIKLTADPTTSGSGGTTSTPPKTTTTYPVQTHQLSVATNARALEKRFSAPNASAGEIENALRRTVGDSRNAKYHAYYVAHKGTWPAQAQIFLTVVQKSAAAA